MTISLNDRVVIITGASSGIGAACARLLARQGCKLTLAARRVGELQRLADQLDAECLVVAADMTAPADINNMVARTLERFGRVDALLANAGVYIRGQFAEGDIEGLTRMFRLNVDGVLRCAHAVIPAMKAQGGGDIIVTSSIAGTMDIVGEPVYSASKNAVQTFVHTVRRQLAGTGIPRHVPGAGSGGQPYAESLRSGRDSGARSRSGNRICHQDDCAEAILFMLSRRATSRFATWSCCRRSTASDGARLQRTCRGYPLGRPPA